LLARPVSLSVAILTAPSKSSVLINAFWAIENFKSPKQKTATNSKYLFIIGSILK
jgi:hypothetical protein